MEIAFLIVGILVGAAVSWLWSYTRGLKQLQAEREGRIAAETRQEETAKHLSDQAAIVEAVKQQLGATFKALSTDALRENSQAFVESARQTLDPVKDTLRRYEDQVRAVETAYRETYGSLDQQLKSLLASEQQLQRETGNLVNALRRPQVRGRWGELTLHRVVELAGMSEHCDFMEQASVTSEGGRLRPDLVVRLPAGRQVVVDAKCSLDAYLSAIEAPDESSRKACLSRHCQQIRDHMNALAQKSYWDQFPAAPEFVVMFIPGESFLAAALDVAPDLFEAGLEKKVLLATPTNLIALLRAVAHVMREEQVAENAARISELGRELYERVRTFLSYVRDLGKRLESATEAYNRAVGSLDSRVLPAARRFRELGAAGGDEIPELEPADTRARQLAAPEADLDPS